jgi:hypothetical protein
MRSQSTLLFGLLALGLPAVALAHDGGSVPDRSGAKSRLMGNMGIGSAVGELGATFTYAPRSAVQIELGAGLGLTGFQLSLMPKATVGTRYDRFVIGVGPSLAIGTNIKPEQTCVSLWLNAEVGYEFRSVSGFSFLMAAGITKGVAGTVPGMGAPGVYEPGDITSPEAARDLPIIPQGRIALGRWF